MPEKMTEQISGARLHITGIVQGVGFRPFIYGLATQYVLTGWIRNTSAGVEIEVEGPPGAIARFVDDIQRRAPPLAKIDHIDQDELVPNGFNTFEIVPSRPQPGAFQPIAADVGTCDDCLRELFDPQDRRYRYPFINCTNCGPRYTIINDIPYDRPNTTMAPFKMCAACAKEYQDPLNRRYHAQPVACPECGPTIWLERDGDELIRDESVIPNARNLLQHGKILAIKGLGGFHLACDATNPAAVAELRQRKLRVAKPFALMMPDVETVADYCDLSEGTIRQLTSRWRPIVILTRKKYLDENIPAIAREVAPGQNTLGVMLPYTPLHSLLLEKAPGFPPALVMTSGNLSDEPIVTGVEEARERLSVLADGFLMHNREIRTRCDDSVSMVGENQGYPIRIGRGFAPLGIRLGRKAPPLLAVGGELKNAFCLTRDEYAFLSQHIGDLENLDTLTAFEDGIKHLESLFRITPEIVAYDLHPGYRATHYALDRGKKENLTMVGVQHHHAHIAACLADNDYPTEEPAIGLAFDGTGYGPDGAIWGGEALVAGYEGYQRSYHLRYTPLPGGDAAARESWRMALSWLRTCGIEWLPDLPSVQFPNQDSLRIVSAMMASQINCPQTSSIGRLFDAVSSLIGICQQASYEAQAAIELETTVNPEEYGAYPFEIQENMLDPAPMFRSLISDILSGRPKDVLAARFHNGLAEICLDLAVALRNSFGISTVALSGGVWQNRVLLLKTLSLLSQNGFQALIHRRVPTNDGGLALGQAVIAMHAINHSSNEGIGSAFTHQSI